jgi:TorA maturation chaperone TorD
VSEALAQEDQARAALYGLIARLFYAPPDGGVLAQILDANAFEGSDAPVGAAWRELAAAAKSAFPVMLENEHTELFVGVGKAEVTPYLTHYTIRYENESPLVDVRRQLQDWGIARKEGVGEPEDHIAGLCEAMRFAIAVQHRDIDEQKKFFERFIYEGGTAFCGAVAASPKAVFYRTVAKFAQAFFELEREAFAME